MDGIKIEWKLRREIELLKCKVADALWAVRNGDTFHAIKVLNGIVEKK